MILGCLWQCLEFCVPGSFTYMVVFPLHWGVGGREEEKAAVSFPTGASGGNVDLCNGVFVLGNNKPFQRRHSGIYLQGPISLASLENPWQSSWWSHRAAY